LIILHPNKVLPFVAPSGKRSFVGTSYTYNCKMSSVVNQMNGFEHEGVNQGGSSDEELRKLYKPLVSKEQAKEVLEKSYADGAEVEVIKQLDSYDDANFRVKIGGAPYLLKIHNGVESEDFNKVYGAAGKNYTKKGSMNSVVHLQSTMMSLLTNHGINTSKPQNATDTKAPVSIHSLPVVSPEHSPRSLVVRLLYWVEGRLMADTDTLPVEALADAGRYLGHIDKVLDEISISSIQPTEKGPPEDSAKKEQLSGWVSFQRRPSTRSVLVSSAQNATNNPLVSAMKLVQEMDEMEDEEVELDSSLLEPARRFHQWDGKNTSHLRGFTRYITDQRRRDLVLSVLDAFQKELLDSGDNTQMRVGVNHGDYNDANIMVDDEFRVSGVIDFGDSVESWRVLDVTVAMAYAMLSSYGKSYRGISAAAAMLRGYNFVYPLTPLERKHLVLLVACRLACSVTLGAYSYQQNPENKYLLFHAEPAWAALEMFWCHDQDRRVSVQKAFKRVLDQACLYHGSSDPKSVISCSDLVFPDPTVADLLAEVRISSPTKMKISEDLDVKPPANKKRKTTSFAGLPVVTFVTGNQNKLNELKRMLETHGNEKSGDSKLPFHLTNKKVDLPELQGDPVEIAKEKCSLATKEVGGAVIVEDTSLCFNALNGMPGPYIKWFLDSCGLEGLNKIIGSYDDKTAYAMTVIAFSTGPGKEPAVFCGRTNGTIVMPRGRKDFGWDPIFQPADVSGDKTYGEMTKDEKDAVSHRSRALAQMKSYFKDNGQSLKQELTSQSEAS